AAARIPATSKAKTRGRRRCLAIETPFCAPRARAAREDPGPLASACRIASARAPAPLGDGYTTIARTFQGRRAVGVVTCWRQTGDARRRLYLLSAPSRRRRSGRRCRRGAGGRPGGTGRSHAARLPWDGARRRAGRAGDRLAPVVAQRLLSP